MCALKSARFLPDGYCSLGDKGNEFLFGINISLPLTTINVSDVVGQWLCLPGYRTSHQWGHIKALIYTLLIDSEVALIARIVEIATTIMQQPGIFQHRSVPAVSSAVYRGRWSYI